MRSLAALVLALVPSSAMAAAGAGESAALVLKALGTAVQLAGFLTVAVALWRLAVPSADKEKSVANLLAVLLIGAVMVGGPESTGMGLLHTTAADLPDTARPIEVGSGSPIGTAVEPKASTVADDASLWGALNAPIGGDRAEGVARASLFQILLVVMGIAAFLLLSIALRAEANDEPDEDQPRSIRDRTTARFEADRSGDGLPALLTSIRDWLARWYDLSRDALGDLYGRLVQFRRRVGIVARSEGGAAAVSMIAGDVRAGGGDVLARLEGYVERASEKRLSADGATARSAANARWIMASHGLATKAAPADLAAQVTRLLGRRLEPEDVARRLRHALDRVELGASEIWVERDGGRFYLASDEDVIAGIADLRRVDAARIDWLASATCWASDPRARLEIRPRREAPAAGRDDRRDEDAEPAGSTPASSMQATFRQIREKLVP
ncbi:hypothetical protein BHAOGJBA_4176 [Methylobacterium hispanicum]|uniref:Histidine kinase n=1 Tax=Methylobacterium hispanicum TaxID=270350 RepID=A0AAV4ZQ30_9HYPH|nr:hypothetical protein [Methylobacterium hispanicum]GJD90634.1 hypothetical protein BHAOGJBA_4176 [Methylobacterium hispanicum]